MGHNLSHQHSHYYYSTSTTSSEGEELSHVDPEGRAKMVDVGLKSVSRRTAVAEGRILLGETAWRLVEQNKVKKGDVLTVSQLAGLMAVKQTSNLIPLCHPLNMDNINISLTLHPTDYSVLVRAEVSCTDKTGVEMEALTGVSVALLTVYDMCKAVTKDMTISNIRLLSKTGGKSDYIQKEEELCSD